MKMQGSFFLTLILEILNPITEPLQAGDFLKILTQTLAWFDLTATPSFDPSVPQEHDKLKGLIKWNQF
jgi:hypothetical protein